MIPQVSGVYQALWCVGSCYSSSGGTTAVLSYMYLYASSSTPSPTPQPTPVSSLGNPLDIYHRMRSTFHDLS